MLTWGQLKTEIYQEDDLAEEVFASASEIVGYINDGLRSIEKEIHAMGGWKYFEDFVQMQTQIGQTAYDLPTNIYANRIIGFFNTTKGDEILPIKHVSSVVSLNGKTGDTFQYKIFNTPILADINGAVISGGPKIYLYPAPNDIYNLSLFFIRRVSEVVDDNSIIEIPEGREFLKAYVIERTLNKERLNQDAQESPRTAQLRAQLIASLSGMLADENNQMSVDSGFYNEHN